MTTTRISLADWEKESNLHAETGKSKSGNFTFVTIDHHNPHRQKLWRLSDYLVDTVRGSQVTLVPRSNNVA